jgi:hypothetical protein
MFAGDDTNPTPNSIYPLFSDQVNPTITVQGSAQPPAKKTAGLIEKETDERRTLNVQHRIMNSVNFIKRTEQHPAQALAPPACKLTG